MTDSSGSQTPRGRFSNRSGLLRARIPSLRCRIMRIVPIGFYFRPCITSNRWKNPEPLERMDPLTKGSLFHEVLAEFFRALQQRQMSMATETMDAVLEILDATLTRVAANYAELLAPAVDRVWQDEVAGIRTDLHILGAGARREHGMGAVVV